MLLDLDRFKEINDTLGHHYGDEVLRQVGERLSGLLREEDTVARLGGDEFAILLRSVETPAAGVAVAAAVRRAIAEHFDVAGVRLELGASVGIASFPEHGQDVDVLMQRADVAMYQAKEGRTGRRALRPRARRQQRAAPGAGRRPAHGARARGVRPALPAQGRPAHQRGVGRRGAAALGAPRARLAAARRVHPAGRAHRPHRPADQLRARPRAAPDGRLARAGARHRRRGQPLGAHADRARPARPHRGHVPPLGRARRTALVLEITESMVVADPARALPILARLHELGVEISVDDFGTGFSSMDYLKRLPVKEVKIDRSFVTTMATDARDAAIVRCTIDLARSLGLRVVAEGVETPDVRARLTTLGCDQAQGYSFSRALPAGRVRRLADRARAQRAGAQRVAAASAAGRSATRTIAAPSRGSGRARAGDDDPVVALGGEVARRRCGPRRRRAAGARRRRRRAGGGRRARGRRARRERR